jgi:DNA-binding NarL/FixJ family response regulator
MAELASRPPTYSSLVLSLGTLFREELEMIASVKRRYPHVEVWLARADGRQAAMDEAMGLGADGFIAEDGLHRLAATQERATETCGPGEAAPARLDETISLGEPVLSADELRALLDEPPVFGPASA